jgi:iron complex outermembrane receptor protein
LQNTARQNVLLKTRPSWARGWTATLFANYNGLFQHVNDNNGATAAQINTYGESFALQNTNPKLATFQAYNSQNKKTDMDYVRLQGDLGDVHVDNTAYTYAYVNKTISSPPTSMQTQADITAGITEGLGTIVNGVKKFKSDVPGYTKQNAYRVWGDITPRRRGFRFRLADRAAARRRVVGSLRHPAPAFRLRPDTMPREYLQSLAQ